MKNNSLNTKFFTPIMNDGLIASKKLGDGRFIPMLQIDCSQNRPLFNLINLQAENQPGDVKSVWAKNRSIKSQFLLALEFIRPIEAITIIPFDINKHESLIDSIMISHGLYIQPAELADGVSEGLNKPKVLVEIPDSVVIPNWEKIYRKRIEAKMKDKGLKKTLITETVEEFVKTSRRFLKTGIK